MAGPRSEAKAGFGRFILFFLSVVRGRLTAFAAKRIALSAERLANRKRIGKSHEPRTAY